MKYIFPAIITFTKDDKNFPNGVYEINFPDLEGCFTFGETLEEVFINAKDALNGMLWILEDDKEKTIPKPSNFKDIKCDNNSILTLIEADTLEYRKKYDTSAVKKTLTIPAWLNTKAMENEINFSKVLQEALLKRLGLEC
ncbi:type II toxin-antitoxin system HicB family antitoxin [Megamonas hypermegale]|uniref:type II toxin-antitoxin system HicB family antitoxin n=1 Tax=Megamonas hypermegale TaxID=158847 RepID=UPI00195B2228|nr:type II toxin-antitoxin system HicB family antitoxin [Megamonas hypermegale]